MSKDIHKWTDGKYTLMFDEHTFFVWDNEKEERMTALETTERLNEQQATIEQLRTQLLICQQSKSDDGRFQVWEVPPIPKGMRITTSDGEMMSEKRFRFEKECTENFLTEKGVFYNNERPMGANEIIALLNSLSEENEQLKKEIKSKDKIIEVYYAMVELNE